MLSKVFMKHLLLTTVATLLLIGCNPLQPPGPFNLVHIEPRVIEPLEFVDLTVSNLDEVEDIKSLFSKKVSVESQHDYVFLRQDFDDPESYIRTETVNQYLDVIHDGGAGSSRIDMGNQFVFVKTAETLLFLKEAKPSKLSLITDDLLDLPVSFLPYTGSEERTRHETDGDKGMVLRDYYKQGKITKLKKEPYGIRFEIPDRYEIFYTRLARGDFDHDGYEDLLIFKWFGYIHGNGFYFYTIKLSQDKEIARITDLE
jgi:hypothetical protein